MNILFLSNIPSPYRIDFFNELGKYTNLTVIFEAKKVKNINFNWNIESIKNFNAIFLNEGEIREKNINWSILKYIVKDEYDHIIVTNYAYFTEMIALLKLKFYRIPYFLEIDGGLVKKENILMRKLKTFLISNAKGYFSPNIISDQYLMHYGVQKDKIHRYNFTSLYRTEIVDSIINPKMKNDLRKQNNIMEDRIILAVGQFIQRKGIDILLKSISNIDKSIGVYIIGGEAKIEYLKLIDNREHRVHFINFLSREKLKEYYKMADIFVLPTRYDVWGLAINEAMSNALPIITTYKCGAGTELVHNNYNGFLINPDVDELTKTINLMFSSNIDLEEFSKNSLELIQPYTIENMVETHLEVLNMELN